MTEMFQRKKTFSKLKMKRYARNLEGGHGSPGYAYEQNTVG